MPDFSIIATVCILYKYEHQFALKPRFKNLNQSSYRLNAQLNIATLRVPIKFRSKETLMKKQFHSFLLAIAITVPLAIPSHSVFAHEAKIERNIISVSGTAKANVAPDLAILNLGVLRHAKTAREALDANNAAMKEVLAAMKKAGIEDRDLQTSNFSIRPRYNHHRPKKGEIQKPPTIVGYNVSNNLTVRVRDLSKVGDVLDVSVTLGVNNGGNINFTNEDPKAAISIARGKAMKDALTKATILTNAAGVKLGAIISINENFSAPRPIRMARGKMMAEAMVADSVPISAGENTYSVTVNAQWEINQ